MSHKYPPANTPRVGDAHFQHLIPNLPLLNLTKIHLNHLCDVIYNNSNQLNYYKHLEQFHHHKSTNIIITCCTRILLPLDNKSPKSFAPPEDDIVT